MRARYLSFVLLSSVLATMGRAVAASHPAPGRFVPLHVGRDASRASLPGLNFPVAPPMRVEHAGPVERSPAVTPAFSAPPVLKRSDFPTPEPSPFANPLHRLLMADATAP